MAHSLTMDYKTPSSSAFSPASSYGASIPASSFSTYSRTPHARLHKRGNSTSSIPDAPQGRSSLNFKRTDTPKTTFEDDYEPPIRSATVENKTPKIKPYLKKLTSKDRNRIDLSRPAAENEGLAGLGIDDGIGSQRTASDVQFTSMGPRRHRRSTSNTSQFSTASSLQRPSAPYMHPMRQTPRPYTPPLAQSSYPASRAESEENDDVIMSDEDFRFRQHLFDPSRRSGSISSSSAIPPPSLTLHTSGSLTKLASHSLSQSQTSLPMSLSSPLTNRPRGDTIRSFETTNSPSSRPSLDKAFGFLRERGRDSPVDAAARARDIQAARQAFGEKEEAKERKAEKEALKHLDREMRRKTKLEEREKRRTGTKSRSGSLANSNSNSNVALPDNGPLAGHTASALSNEKTNTSMDIGGREYEAYARTHDLSMPAMAQAAGASSRTEVTPKVTTSRQVKSRWLAFITWFRTRLLRLGRRVGSS
jgi:hypothetical protein